jgi:hypothetical protein
MTLLKILLNIFNLTPTKLLASALGRRHSKPTTNARNLVISTLNRGLKKKPKNISELNPSQAEAIEITDNKVKNKESQMNNLNPSDLVKKPNPDSLLSRINEAGKKGQAYHHLLGNLASLPNDTCNESEKNIEIFSSRLSADLENNERNILSKKVELNITGTKETQANNKVMLALKDTHSTPNELKTEEEAAKAVKPHSFLRKYWVEIVFTVTLIESLISFGLLSHAKNEIFKFRLESLAASLMTGILFLSAKVTRKTIGSDGLAKASKYAMIGGAISLVLFTILVRGFAAKYGVEPWFTVLEGLLLIGATMILPIACGLAVDASLEQTWGADDKKEQVAKIVLLFANERNALTQQRELIASEILNMESNQTAFNHLNTELEIARLELSKLKLAKQELRVQYVNSGRDHYLSGLNTLNAVMSITPERMEELKDGVIEYARFLVEESESIDPTDPTDPTPASGRKMAFSTTESNLH